MLSLMSLHRKVKWFQLSNSTKMNHKLPTKELSQTKCSQSTFRKDHAVKRHVSYGRRDDHVKDTEEMLMKKYRMGYSQLHKYLILKESNTYFANPFV